MLSVLFGYYFYCVLNVIQDKKQEKGLSAKTQKIPFPG